MDTESDSLGTDNGAAGANGVRPGRAMLAEPPLLDPASLDLRPPSPWRRFGPGGPDGRTRLISVLVLAILVLVCLVLAVAGVVKATDNAAQAARAAAAYTPPPPSAAIVAASVVSVIGDAASGASSSATAWPALVAKQLKATVLPSAVAGKGWIGKSATATFVTDAAGVSPASTVVVFFGGASDQSQTSLAVVQAEGKAIAAVRKQAPRAKIVVVGPLSTAAKPPLSLLRVRDAERTAAQAAKVRFVDPIAGKWFSGRAGVVGSDGVPTDKGQQLIAAALVAVLQPLT